jgi:hypothetical protein
MEFIVRVEARLAGRLVKVCDVVTIARPGVVRGEEELGLSLEDGKEIVRELQSRVIAVQVEMLEAANSLCIDTAKTLKIDALVNSERSLEWFGYGAADLSFALAAAVKPGTNGRCGTCGGRTPLPNLGIYSRSSEATCRTEGQHNY